MLESLFKKVTDLPAFRPAAILKKLRAGLFLENKGVRVV